MIKKVLLLIMSYIMVAKAFIFDFGKKADTDTAAKNATETVTAATTNEQQIKKSRSKSNYSRRSRISYNKSLKSQSKRKYSQYGSRYNSQSPYGARYYSQTPYGDRYNSQIPYGARYKSLSKKNYQGYDYDDYDDYKSRGRSFNGYGGQPREYSNYSRNYGVGPYKYDIPSRNESPQYFREASQSLKKNNYGINYNKKKY